LFIFLNPWFFFLNSCGEADDPSVVEQAQLEGQAAEGVPWLVNLEEDRCGRDGERERERARAREGEGEGEGREREREGVGRGRERGAEKEGEYVCAACIWVLVYKGAIYTH